MSDVQQQIFDYLKSFDDEDFHEVIFANYTNNSITSSDVEHAMLELASENKIEILENPAGFRDQKETDQEPQTTVISARIADQ